MCRLVTQQKLLTLSEYCSTGLNIVLHFLARLSHKIVDLDFAPFSENFENHWFIPCKSYRHAVIT